MEVLIPLKDIVNGPDQILGTLTRIFTVTISQGVGEHGELVGM